MNKSVGIKIAMLISSSASFSAYGAACISAHEQTEALQHLSEGVSYIGSEAISGNIQFTSTITGCGNTLVLVSPGDGTTAGIFNGRTLSLAAGVQAFSNEINSPIVSPTSPVVEVTDPTVTDPTTPAVDPANPAVDPTNPEVAPIVDNHEEELRSLSVQTRQITRQTTNTIAQRLSANISKVFSGQKLQNKIGGSSDSSSTGGLAFWGATNFSQTTEDDGEAVHIDNDIYQFLGGFDSAIGDLFFGTALTYAYAENEQIGSDSISNTVGITPYLAYKLNDFMFVSGLVGYNYTGVISPGPDTDVHEYYTEANLTAFKEINSFILKARAGVRYNHSFASIKTGFDNSSDELTWIGDAEVGYRFDNGLTTYTGVLFEHYDREASGNNGSVYHDGVFYMRWGADYPIADKVSIGANIETDLNNKSTSLIAGGVNIRVEI